MQPTLVTACPRRLRPNWLYWLHWPSLFQNWETKNCVAEHNFMNNRGPLFPTPCGCRGSCQWMQRILVWHWMQRIILKQKGPQCDPWIEENFYFLMQRIQYCLLLVHPKILWQRIGQSFVTKFLDALIKGSTGSSASKIHFGKKSHLLTIRLRRW